MTKLLVLSDDPQVIVAVTQLTGYEIVLLRDADDGAKESGGSNLALVDIAFSSSIGTEGVIQQYLTREIPVILTGDAHHQAEIAACLNHGAEDYLLKPLHPVLLEKRVQRISEAAQYDRLVGFYAHEIKNPLVPVVGWIDMVRSEIEQLDLNAIGENMLKDIIPDWLMVVRANAIRIEYLINDLRDMSTLLSGRELYLDTEAVDIVPLIQAVVENETSRLRDRELNLQFDLPDTLPPVTADTHYMPRLFWNLLTGAVKSSEPETTITIAAQVAGEFLHFSVRDEGIGRTPNEIESAFVRSYDTHTGVRLSRAIVHRHGGEFRAEKNAGKGITVHFTLPVAPTLPEIS